MKLCSASKHANEEVAERMIRVKACWLQITSQLEFLREIAPTLQPEHQAFHLEISQILDGKLVLVVSRLRSLFTEPSTNDASSVTLTAAAQPFIATSNSSRSPVRQLQLKPWKYAIFKEKLDSSIADLENWQRIFDPSWYLILRSVHNKPLLANMKVEIIEPPDATDSTIKQTPVVLETVAQKFLEAPKMHVFLPEDAFGTMVKQPIRGSTAAIGFRASYAHRSYILETFASPQDAQSDVVARNVRNVAAKLTTMEPKTFGLLRCKGVVRHRRSESRDCPSFTYVFNLPEGHADPQSLRQALIEDASVHSLSERFRLASELAKAVSYIHVIGFVHKNIRPDTVLLLQNGSSSLGSAYLVGFERIRNADGHTFRLGEASWQKDLYHHPDRQGVVPEEMFVMQHDIYSLGVCLLEIGLWKSLIVPEDGEADQPGKGLRLPSRKSDGTGPMWHKVEMKEHLVRLAEVELPPKMGTRYAEVVVTCLTCLDRGNVDFGDEEQFQDEDGIVVGVRFIEKVRASRSYSALVIC